MFGGCQTRTCIKHLAACTAQLHDWKPGEKSHVDVEYAVREHVFTWHRGFILLSDDHQMKVGGTRTWCCNRALLTHACSLHGLTSASDMVLQRVPRQIPRG